ncbi:MAG: helicase HerA domain-containing protein, partial [Terriglobia bacterium]
MALNNLTGWLLGSRTVSRELRETHQAWDTTQAHWRASVLSKKGPDDLAVALVQQAIRRADRVPVPPVLYAVVEAVETLYRAEDIGDLVAKWPVIETSVGAATEFREMLPRRRRWSADFDQMNGAFERIVLENIEALFQSLPESCFPSNDDERGDSFEVPLIDLLDDPVSAVERLFMLPYDDDSFRLDIFKKLRELCGGNLLEASGFLRSDNIRERQHKLVLPAKQKNKTGAEIAELYLSGSPLKALLDIPVPFRIPDELRCEHCHIVGGTGHGKTQLMQKMIHADLIAAKEDGRSVIVIDSQGDLINKLVRLELFSPDAPNSLADRLVVIDPADVEFPAALNLFDAHLDRVREYGPADKERVLNGVIELYELFFGAFLGAELTQKQGVIFKYLARLMLAVPDATIHTLMRIMEDGKPFKQYMDQLDGSARYFFLTEFFHPSFAATKKQVLRRLW